MNTIQVQQKYKSAISQRNALFAMTLILLFLVSMLVFTVMSQKTRVVLVPSRVSDGMVALGAQDNRYIEAIALDVVYAMFNVTPASLRHNRAVIERVTSAQQREGVLAVFDDTSKDFERRNITTAFFPVSIAYELSSKRVRIEGQIKTFLNTTLVSVETKVLAVYFSEEAGSYRVSGIHEIKEGR